MYDNTFIRVEELEGVKDCDVEVHVGDFLAFLTREYFTACLHRVVQPRNTSRISSPFLVRLRPDHILDTTIYDVEKCNPNFVEIKDVSCRDLRLLLDQRGQRILQERREIEEAELKRQQAELERQRRAREFMQQLRAEREAAKAEREAAEAVSTQEKGDVD